MRVVEKVKGLLLTEVKAGRIEVSELNNVNQTENKFR
jgi:hypothetical protein